ncbi:YitT family protein [Mycoplasmopsis felis]|uniref:YitT family protein n=1 Tax=Mycoplasmopsis felis TaxID=33923 RepID=UPI002AFDCB4D|nr:YitT family protein [Mycoplasmopsis felis]WQQ04336.1 YitT family protein [Mycoplasmopsis felis]
MKDNQIRYSRKRMNSSLLILGFFYKINTPWKKLLTLTTIGIIASISGVLLLQNTGLYALGAEAIGQSFGNLVYYLKDSKILFDIIFWIMYFIFNIPLFILSYLKISKNFTWYNMYFIFIYSFSGLLFASIPGIEKIFIFANLDATLLNENPLSQLYKEYNIRVVLWNNPSDNFKQLSIFIYAISFGLIQGLATVTSLILGASTGGYDIYGVYAAKIKFKDISSIFFILNIISLFIANIIGTYIPTSIAISSIQNKVGGDIQKYQEIFNYNKPWGFDLFFNPNFVSGIFMLLVNAIFVNLTFPKYKLVQTQIYCTNPFELIQEINEKTHRIYTFSIHKITGGYSKQEQFMITTNTQYLDAVGLFEEAKSINNNLFISIIDIKKGDGFIFVEE